MRDWRDVWRRLFPRQVLRSDIDDELDFHIDGRVAELIRRGLTEEKARHEVMKRFGDRTQVREDCHRMGLQRIEREEWSMVIDNLWHDVRMAGRSLSRQPGLSAVIVLTLALGIGTTTAIFSVVNGVLLRPLPYEDAARLAMIWENDRATGTVREPASVLDFFDFRERSQAFDGMAMYATGSLNLTRAGGEPRRLRVVTASADLLRVLGVAPALGRAITAAEDVPGGEPVALFTHAFWQDAFAAAPEVIGTLIELNDRSHTVIGVLPPGFDFPDLDYDLWIPLQRDSTNSARARHDVRVLGRLAAASSFANASEELASIAADLEASYRENANRGVFVEPLTDYRRGGAETTLWLLFAAVTTVLAIACANVANLLLARGAARAQETAVYVALGASDARLARRFLAEGLLLTGLALLAGGMLSTVGLGALLALAPPQLLGQAVVGIDSRVLLFAAATSALIGVGCGLLPTLQARRVDVQSALKAGRSQAEAAAVSKLFMRRCLVAGQTSLWRWCCWSLPRCSSERCGTSKESTLGFVPQTCSEPISSFPTPAIRATSGIGPAGPNDSTSTMLCWRAYRLCRACVRPRWPRITHSRLASPTASGSSASPTT